jgi:pimeloyl-ACP methyl ester carboxylesterase
MEDQAIVGAVSGEFVTETFGYDGGRQVTVYIPPDPPEAVVFAGDGQLISRWGEDLETAGVPSTMIVGVHRPADETLRLHEYSPALAPERFAAHARFFVEDVRRWTQSRFGVALPADRTAVCGVSAGGELALAIGLRHPDIYGAVFCASPGAGYRPPALMPSSLPRAYLVAGTLEPFFLENATRWAAALRDAGADVVMTERVGSHGDEFWRQEFPLMVAWAFGQSGPAGSVTAPAASRRVSSRRPARDAGSPGTDVRVRPVVQDAATVVHAVAESLGQPLSLDSVLDVDVYRLRPTDGGPDLVARAFGAGVEAATVNAAARVLTRLAGTPFPAERCASDSPVLPLGGGRHLLVTEYVEPAPAPSPGFILAWCAGLLARLATRSARDLPSGGGWHRLGATPSDEIAEALRLGGQIGPSVGELVDTLADADDGTGLPEALIHADLTPPNAVPRGDQPPVIIDWIGAGRGPRAWPLAFLLFAAGPRGARRGLDRYTRSISLSEEELRRLPGMLIARPLALDLWSVAHERMTVQQSITRCHAHRARAEAVAAALRDPDRP